MNYLKTFLLINLVCFILLLWALVFVGIWALCWHSPFWIVLICPYIAGTAVGAWAIAAAITKRAGS